jgi:carbamate kinase
VELLAAGHRLGLTHGNGPQVGEELLRMEIARPVMPAFRTLVDSGVVAIAVGGGGIPVVETPAGFRGVEAVIEKDLATAQRFLDRLSVDEARRLLAAGEFPSGSMGPKVAAAIEFAERGGEAVITSLACVGEALKGTAGTVISRE